MSLNVEQAIADVASVYQALTGKPFVPGRYESPPEVNPLEQAEANYRQFKRLVEQKSQNAPDLRKGAPPVTFAPPVDVYEFEREVRVFVDLPAVAREQVHVSVLGDTLSIRAERQMNRHASGVCRVEERKKGVMLRTIALPPHARRDGIDAMMRDGVLTICIPTDGSSGGETEIPIEVK